MAMDFFEPFTQYGEVPNTGSATLPSGMTANGWSGASADPGSNWFSLGAAFGRFPTDRGLKLLTGQSTNACYALNNLNSNNATEFYAFTLYYPVIPSDNSVIFHVMDAGTAQLSFIFRTGGVIQVYRGSGSGTLLLTTVTGVLPLNQWISVELKVTINSSTGYIEWRQSGVTKFTFSGNTQNTSNAYQTGFGVGKGSWSGTSGGPGQIYYGMFVAWNPSGSSPTTFMGDKRLYPIFPNSAGDVTNFTKNFGAWAASTVEPLGTQIKDSNNNVQRVTAVTSDSKTGGSTPTWATTGGATTVDNHVTWTCVGSGSNPGNANWMAVAETPPDGDSSYNSSSNVGDIDRFVGAAAPTTMTGIIFVSPIFYSRKDDAGVRSLRASINSGGTVADNGTDEVQNSSYAYFGMGANGAVIAFLTDPNTGLAWTITAVNALDFGYKVTA